MKKTTTQQKLDDRKHMETEALNILSTNFVTVTNVTTLTNTVTTVSAETITAIQTFYEMAWEKLIWLLSFFGGLVVLVIPLVVNYLQSRLFKHDKKVIKEDIKTSVESSTAFLEERIKAQEENLRASIEKQQKDIEELAQGASHLVIFSNATQYSLQGYQHDLNKHYGHALASYYTAFHTFETGDDKKEAIEAKDKALEILRKNPDDEELKVTARNILNGINEYINRAQNLKDEYIEIKKCLKKYIEA